MSEHSLQNSGAKYVSNKMSRQIQYFFSLPRQCISKKTAKDSSETFVYHASNGFGIPVDTTYSTYIILFTYNTLE